ncbi:uncharacterized protein LOC105689341 [Athalia rosae]|uniref:uncharacterized protein LOC105689341 n=1 Tax=Athalia rosae TaxID=37344 RepID=UPI000625667D|nr:uncharacterized protein LOC105689341 [Athalia rosae]
MITVTSASCGSAADRGSIEVKNSTFLIRLISKFLKNFLIIIITIISVTGLNNSVSLARALNIEPNNDKPCVVGDAWAAECMSCVCLENRVASCKPSFCATRLRRELDDCKEGEITHVDCNTCHCKNNERICTKYDCGGKGAATGHQVNKHGAKKMTKKKETKRTRRVKDRA